MKNSKNFLIIAAILCAGCATNEQFVHFPEQSKRVEDPAKARIYVVRPSSFGAEASMEIWDTGRHIANTGANAFVCWERPPGKAEISGREENTSTLDLTVETNQVYYIFQHVRLGWFQPRNKLEVISEVDGTKEVKKCKPPKTDRHCSDHPECRCAKQEP